MSKITRIILFDAANTLIYKPILYYKIRSVLAKYSYEIEEVKLQYHHKLLSEIINFPDRTSKEFYKDFNSELLLSLGIIPSEEILNEIFSACSYLEWKAFDDLSILNELPTEKAVLSNFNSNLGSILDQLIGKNIFSEIIISENENYRKPSLEFYELALKKLNVNPEEVLYIGDSLKLDVIPAKKLGIKTLLIDRQNIFSSFTDRINNMKDIINYL
ncbi:HAD family hydrolase [Chryseobacterium hispalense]|uniref:HAD family hydrolase n=1 Tax=Chryseobacterium hispalense TaxID=1453492 RepID=UPI0004931EAD|nr:HAD family hydrolase [Chryseobacterium hispalense]